MDRKEENHVIPEHIKKTLIISYKNGNRSLKHIAMVLINILMSSNLNIWESTLAVIGSWYRHYMTYPKWGEIWQYLVKLNEGLLIDGLITPLEIYFEYWGKYEKKYI